MPDFFTKPPSSGNAKLPIQGKPNLMDLIGEGLLSPLGLGSDTSGMAPEQANSLKRAGAGGDLLAMLLPGLGALSAAKGVSGAAAASRNVPQMAQSTATIMEDLPSLREFMAVGAEPKFVRPHFGDSGELAYGLAKKTQERKNLAAQAAR